MTCRPLRWVRSILLPSMIATACPVAAQAANDQPFLFEGFFYEAAPDGGHDPTPADRLALGDAYVFVGHVTAFADFLLPAIDPEANEYTVLITGGTVALHSMYAGFHAVQLDGDIHVQVREDPVSGGTPAEYVSAPPNGSVPANFQDGMLVLGATLGSFQVVWSPTGTGSWSAMVAFDGGAWLDSLPPQQGKQYQIGGQLSPQPLPEGYDTFATGGLETYWIDPVEPTSWGRLKRLYRR